MEHRLQEVGRLVCKTSVKFPVGSSPACSTIQEDLSRPWDWQYSEWELALAMQIRLEIRVHPDEPGLWVIAEKHIRPTAHKGDEDG